MADRLLGFWCCGGWGFFDADGVAHSATRGSRSSIFIPAYFINICGPLRRREPTLFMTVHREIAEPCRETSARSREDSMRTRAVR